MAYRVKEYGKYDKEQADAESQTVAYREKTDACRKNKTGGAKFLKTIKKYAYFDISDAR